MDDDVRFGPGDRLADRGGIQAVECHRFGTEHP